MDTSNGNKWKKNPASAALRNKIKDNASKSDKLKPGLRSSKQNKSIKSINKIVMKKDVRSSNSSTNLDSKVTFKLLSSVKRVGTIEKASKLFLSNKKQKTINKKSSTKCAETQTVKLSNNTLWHRTTNEDKQFNLARVGYPSCFINGKKLGHTEVCAIRE